MLGIAVGLIVGLVAGLGVVPGQPPGPASASPGAGPGAEARAAAPSLSLSVMSFNIFYGGDDYDLKTGDWCPVIDGCPQGLRKIARIIRATGADVVGLQEAERNTRALAKKLGWYADPRAQVISRYPVLRPAGGRGLYTFVEPVPGHIVAVANTHLPSTPYGPYKVQRGNSKRKVLGLERRLRVPALKHILRLLPRLADRGIPVFLTGDFNSPSHLDWTRAVADVRDDVRYPIRWPASATLADAGFVDSYRRIHPDPVADPGFTWTPGSPEGRKNEVFDRIDWVLSLGPATAVDSRLVGEKGNPQADVTIRGRFPSDHRGVVSTFDITPAEAPLIVSPANRRVLVGKGSRLKVRFHAAGTTTETVAIVPRGRTGRPLVARSTGGLTSGRVTLPTARLAQGRYLVVLRDTATGKTLARSPIWVYPRSSRAHVTTDARTYRAGQPIVVSWDRAPGQHLDWVALYRCPSSCEGPGSYLAYRYTGTRIEGSLRFSAKQLPGEMAPEWPLPPGQYVARLFADDGYRITGQSPRFRVLPG